MKDTQKTYICYVYKKTAKRKHEGSILKFCFFSYGLLTKIAITFLILKIFQELNPDTFPNKV